MTDKIDVPQNITSIDDMCAVLKFLGVKAAEYTDCAILYNVTFDRLRSIYDKGRECGSTCKSPAAPIGNKAEQSFPERDLTIPAEQQGLFRKFEVRRVDGSDAPGGKHHGCRYFVLDMDHDPHAPTTLRAYAISCADTHLDLSADLLAELPNKAEQAHELLTGEQTRNILNSCADWFHSRSETTWAKQFHYTNLMCTWAKDLQSICASLDADQVASTAVKPIGTLRQTSKRGPKKFSLHWADNFMPSDGMKIYAAPQPAQDILTWQKRCEIHAAHQTGIITDAMIRDRMQEEIDDLRR